jgi:hypothetical protein
MAIKAIAHSYWRSIKRGTRTFESVVNNPKESVRELADDIRTLAQTDVENGEITATEYEQFLGEAYPAE